MILPRVHVLSEIKETYKYKLNPFNRMSRQLNVESAWTLVPIVDQKVAGSIPMCTTIFLPTILDFFCIRYYS